MHDSARKIQKWWKNLETYHHTSNLVVEILVQAKLIREAYVAKHALLVQRSFRKWRDHKYAVSLRRAKPGIIKLQAHFRRRRAARHVEFYREFIGLRLMHLVHNTVILVADRLGKLTLSREIAADDDVEKLPLSRIVNIPGLSARQRDQLACAVTPIQSMEKWRLKNNRVTDIQRVWRGHLTRKMLQHRHRNATRIQAAWRVKNARGQLKEARIAATKIEARIRGASVRNKNRQERYDPNVSVGQDDYDYGEEVVDGRRIRRGGSVLN
jgi:hypothetical protein